MRVTSKLGLAAGVVALLLAAGCSDTVPAEPTATAEVTQEIDTSSGPRLYDSTLDEVFLMTLDVEDFTYSSPEAIIGIAHNICDTLDTGVSKLEMMQVAIDGGYGPYDAGYLVGASTGVYCPEHS